MDSDRFFSLISQDIDEMVAALPAQDMEWRQLSRGRFHGQLKFAQFDAIELFYLSWNQAMQIRGSLPPGTVGFGMEISSQGRSIWRGLEYDNRDVLINSDQEVDLKIPAGYEMFAVRLKRDLLLEHADLQQRHLHPADLEKSLVRANPAALNAIKAYLQSSLDMLERVPADRNPCSDAQSITQDVVSLLITMLLSAEDSATQPLRVLQRIRLIKQLEQHMLAHINQTLTIDHLCAVAGISERSLNNYFHDLLDMSPMAYFKALRLNRVRSALKLANPTIDKVNLIANQWGFQHMGYFSVDYKVMFGESPSETLWRSTQ
ncbi:MAG TPA: helix-turn-helix domain-containing protein [Coleofasciculaceae cyanobacterium]